jgi:hypothetical protein
MGISLSTVIPDHFPQTPFLAYLINSSDRQHKEPQHQRWEQQCCQPTTDPRESFDDASSNASDYAAKHGQHAECSTPSPATAAKR